MTTCRIANVLCAILTAVPAIWGATPDAAGILRRQTQELVDAIASGTASVWQRYLDPQATFTTEDGAVQSKLQMIAQTKPLPSGVSGSIQVIDFHVVLHGPVAITNYILDEHEVYHGHKLYCQYRSTDTWIRQAAGWRLVASQIMALRTDPPAIALPARQLAEYAGRYSLAPGITYEIQVAGDKVLGQAAGGKPEPLLAEAPDVFFVPGKPRYRKVFQRATDGHISGFAERREAWDLVWARLP